MNVEMTETTPFVTNDPQQSLNCNIIRNSYDSFCQRIQRVVQEVTLGMSWALGGMGIISLGISAYGFHSYSPLIPVPSWVLGSGGAFFCVVTCVSAVCLRRLTIPNLNPLLNSIAEDVASIRESQRASIIRIEMAKTEMKEEVDKMSHSCSIIGEIRQECDDLDKDADEHLRKCKEAEKMRREDPDVSGELNILFQNATEKKQNSVGSAPPVEDEIQRRPGQSENATLSST